MYCATPVRSRTCLYFILNSLELVYCAGVASPGPAALLPAGHQPGQLQVAVRLGLGDLRYGSSDRRT